MSDSERFAALEARLAAAEARLAKLEAPVEFTPAPFVPFMPGNGGLPWVPQTNPTVVPCPVCGSLMCGGFHVTCEAKP